MAHQKKGREDSGTDLSIYKLTKKGASEGRERDCKQGDGGAEGKDA